MTNMTRRFTALAAPPRRLVFERVARGSKPVTAIAKGLPVSRPAVSQHLKVLREAGLVVDRPDGARRIYEVDLRGLGAIRTWLDQFRDDTVVKREPDNKG